MHITEKTQDTKQSTLNNNSRLHLRVTSNLAEQKIQANILNAKFTQGLINGCYLLHSSHKSIKHKGMVTQVQRSYHSLLCHTSASPDGRLHPVCCLHIHHITIFCVCVISLIFEAQVISTKNVEDCGCGGCIRRKPKDWQHFALFQPPQVVCKSGDKDVSFSHKCSV